jgi:hypothetical protein
VVAAPSADCSASSLQVAPWRGRLKVDAHGTATVMLAVRLVEATAACAGARWQLAYTAS